MLLSNFRSCVFLIFFFLCLTRPFVSAFTVGFYSDSQCTSRWSVEPLDLTVADGAGGVLSPCTLLTTINIVVSIPIYGESFCAPPSSFEIGLYSDSACTLPYTTAPITGTGTTNSCAPTTIAGQSVFVKSTCAPVSPSPSTTPQSSSSTITASLIAPSTICPASILSLLPIPSSTVFLDASASFSTLAPASSLMYVFSATFSSTAGASASTVALETLALEAYFVSLNQTFAIVPLPQALFVAPGVYTFTVSVSDGVSATAGTASATMTVLSSSSGVSQLSLSSLPSLSQYTRVLPLIINAALSLPLCQSTPLFFLDVFESGLLAYTYTWTSSPAIASITLSSVTGPTLFIPPFTLDPAVTYNITVTAFPWQSPASPVASASIIVSSLTQAPVANIAGGLIRTLSSSTVTLDATQSYDPNTMSSSSLTYQWSCVVPLTSLSQAYTFITNAASAQSFFTSPTATTMCVSGSTAAQTSTVTVTFTQAGVYGVSLTVTNSASMMASLPVFAFIVVTPASLSLPTLSSVFVSDVSGGTSAFTPLRLLGSIPSVSSASVAWAWSCTSLTPSGVSAPFNLASVAPSFLLSSLTQPLLVLDRNYLTPGYTYIFTLSASLPNTNTNINASLSLTLPALPVSSSTTPFTVSPLTGLACSTLFTLSANGWTSSSSSSLRYAFTVRSRLTSLLSEVPLILTPSTSPSASVYLPPGDITVTLYVLTPDGYRASSSMNVTVSLPSSLSHNSSTPYSSSPECYAVSVCATKLVSSSATSLVAQSFQLVLSVQQMLTIDSVSATKYVNVNVTQPLAASNAICALTSKLLNETSALTVRQNLRFYLLSVIQNIVAASSSPSSLPLSLSPSQLALFVSHLTQSFSYSFLSSSSIASVLSASINLIGVPSSVLSITGANASDVSQHVVNTVSNLLTSSQCQSLSTPLSSTASASSSLSGQLLSSLSSALLSSSVPGEAARSATSADGTVSYTAAKVRTSVPASTSSNSAYANNGLNVGSSSQSSVLGVNAGQLASSWSFPASLIASLASSSSSGSLLQFTTLQNTACYQALLQKGSVASTINLLSNVVVDAAFLTSPSPSLQSSTSSPISVSGLSSPITFSLPISPLSLLSSSSPSSSSTSPSSTTPATSSLSSSSSPSPTSSSSVCPPSSVFAPQCGFFDRTSLSWSTSGCTLVSLSITSNVNNNNNNVYTAQNTGAPCMTYSSFVPAIPSGVALSSLLSSSSTVSATCQCSHLTEFAMLNDPQSLSSVDRSIALAFSCLFLILCVVSSVQLVRMMLVQSLASILTLPVIMHIHVAIVAGSACHAIMLLMRAVPSDNVISVSQVPTVVLGLLVALPLCFVFAANCRFVLSWIMIARLSSQKKSDTDRMIVYFIYASSALICAFIIILFAFSVTTPGTLSGVSMQSQNNAVEAFTILIALAYIAVGVATNVYGSFITCSVLKTASTLHLSGPTGAFMRLFAFGQLLSIFFIISGVCWLISAVSLSDFYGNTSLYMSLGYGSDACCMVIMLLMFEKGVRTIARDHEKKLHSGSSSNINSHSHSSGGTSSGSTKKTSPGTSPGAKSRTTPSSAKKHSFTQQQQQPQQPQLSLVKGGVGGASGAGDVDGYHHNSYMASSPSQCPVGASLDIAPSPLADHPVIVE